MSYIGQKYDLPPVFYLDLWPMANPLMMVNDPDVAHQITQAKSLPKHPVNAKVLRPLTGSHSVVTAEGAEWKMLRSILNPGFAPQYLSTLVPLLVRHVSVFKDRLARYASTHEVFPVQEIAMNLTIDVIGEVVLGINLDSQRRPSELAQHFKQAALWAGPSMDVISYHLSLPFKWWHCRQQDRIIEKMIRDRHVETMSLHSSGGTTTRAAVDLFLEAYREEKMGKAAARHKPSDSASTDRDLDPEFLLLARNNVKTLLLGGHDTTSTTIAYLLALLSEPENAAELARVRAEHDAVFGPDATQAGARILADPRLLNNLPLTTAAIKETLRLFPPASTTRTTVPSHPVQTVTLVQGGCDRTLTLPLADQQIWVSHYGMGQRGDLWPEPRRFQLDRFLPETTKQQQVKDAWRPFEKGPRGCLGLELAMMELRLLLVMVVRRFDFHIAYSDDAPRAPPEHGVAGGRGYQIVEFAAKPVGHMPVRVTSRAVDKGM